MREVWCVRLSRDRHERYLPSTFAPYRSTWARLTCFFSRSVAIAKSLNSLFEEPVGQLLIADENLNIIVFEAQNEVIVQWIP